MKVSVKEEATTTIGGRRTHRSGSSTARSDGVRPTAVVPRSDEGLTYLPRLMEPSISEPDDRPVN